MMKDVLKDWVGKTVQVRSNGACDSGKLHHVADDHVVLHWEESTEPIVIAIPHISSVRLYP